MQWIYNDAGRLWNIRPAEPLRHSRTASKGTLSFRACYHLILSFYCIFLYGFVWKLGTTLFFRWSSFSHQHSLFWELSDSSPVIPQLCSIGMAFARVSLHCIATLGWSEMGHGIVGGEVANPVDNIGGITWYNMIYLINKKWDICSTKLEGNQISH